MNQVIGLIPAAGMGSRLFPYPCPKELLPIGGQYVEIDGKFQLRPKVVSQFLVENMAASGVEEVVFVINPNKSDVMKYYNDGQAFHMHVSYVCQKSPLGLPPALDCAYNLLKDKTVVFGLPDTIIEPQNLVRDLLDVLERETETDLVIGMFRHPDPSKLGMVELGENGVVCGFIDKPQETDLEFAWGLVAWKPAFTEYLHAFVQKMHHEQDYTPTFSDVMTSAIADGYVIKGVVGESFVDIGTFDELARYLTSSLQEMKVGSDVLVANSKS